MHDYKLALDGRGLDYIAITDHNTVSFALEARQVLGERIIVGEEIMTTEGEIIGLYLNETVPPGLTPEETIKAIRRQNGLIYIPHPFEKVRSGLQASVMDRIKDSVDIVEVFNGRALYKKTTLRAADWAEKHSKSIAASSDAHGRLGWRRTYTLVDAKPDRSNLITLLHKPNLVQKGVGVSGLLYPKINRYIIQPKKSKG